MAYCPLLDSHGHLLINTEKGLEMVSPLVAHGGNLVYLDTELGCLHYQGEDNVPASGPNGYVLKYRDQFPSRFRIIQMGHFIYLEHLGLHFAASPEGTIFPSRLQEIWERFLPISLGMFDFLKASMQNGLYSRNLSKLVPGQHIQLHDFEVDYEDQSFNLVDNMEISAAAGENCIMLNNMALDTVFHLNPAIYFCAFGEAKAFRLTEMLIQSHLLFSGVNFNFIIFTDIEDVVLCDELEQVSDRIQIVYHSCFNAMERLYFRYHATTLKVLQEYQPLIYSDIDVICNASLEDLVLNAFMSDQVGCSLEHYDVHDPERLHWYFSDFVTRDPTLAQAALYPVNSGVFTFRNHHIMTPVAQAIDKVSSKIVSFHPFSPHHTELPSYVMDQSVFNYCLTKLDLCDAQSISPFVANWPGLDFEKIPRVGMAHFCGDIGKFEKKSRYIEEYLQWLKAN